MFSIIPIYMILAGVAVTELEYRGYVAPMDPLQSYGLSLLTGVMLFAYVEYAISVWPNVRRLSQLPRQEAERPLVLAPMEEGGK